MFLVFGLYRFNCTFYLQNSKAEMVLASKEITKLIVDY
jgi:hypothetical protein